MQDNNTMDAARLNALERDMGKALEKLEYHAIRLGELIAKIERSSDERTEVALLKNQVSTINAHVDAMSTGVNERLKDMNERLESIEELVTKGQGLRFGWNLLLSGIATAAAVYAWWKANVR